MISEIDCTRIPCHINIRSTQIVKAILLLLVLHTTSSMPLSDDTLLPADLKKLIRLESNLSFPRRFPIILENTVFRPDTGNVGPKFWLAPSALPGSVWPLPFIMKDAPQILLLNHTRFAFNMIGASNAILDENMQRYRSIIAEQMAVSFLEDLEEAARYKMLSRHTPRFNKVEITVDRLGQDYPHLDMDEWYELKIANTGLGSIHAHETWGVLRALETLAQLIKRGPDDKLYVNVTHITDAPRYRYRGLLVDTSRHFIKKDTLLRNLDAMAMNKLNVFHWHIVDDTSFPFQSRVWPHLSAKGAYDPKSMVYTHEDVKEIVEYARFRGIRVIPEFDTPGHTHSWGRGYPQLLTPCYQTLEQLSSLSKSDAKNAATDAINFAGLKWTLDGNFGPMNVAKESTYDFLEKLFSEILSLFPDETIHVGGDETEYECWLSNPLIRTHLVKNLSHTAPHLLMSYHFNRLDEILKRIGNRRGKTALMQFWHDGFCNGLQIRENSTIEVWLNDDIILKLLDMGYRVVYSACWYLDHFKGWIEWINFYKCDEKFFKVSKAPNLIGGEASMWAEYQSDSTILTRIWPLAAAAAERLWSQTETFNFRSIAQRMEEHRCRMMSRGINVGVASGAGTCYRVVEPNSYSNDLAVLNVSDSAPKYYYDYEEPTQLLLPNQIAWSSNSFLLGVLVIFSVVMSAYTALTLKRLKCKFSTCPKWLLISVLLTYSVAFGICIALLGQAWRDIRRLMR